MPTKHKVEKLKAKREIVHVNGKEREVVTVHDNKGKTIHKIITPIMHTFDPKDLLQVIIGATILAIPVGFTEETWRLGGELPLWNNLILMMISVIFIGAFVFYTYHGKVGNGHGGEFLKRVVSTYVFSFLVVAILLTLIQRAPWMTEWALALKRVIIVTLPASMSAAVADTLK